jgi:hypothetical protein
MNAREAFEVMKKYNLSHETRHALTERWLPSSQIEAAFQKQITDTYREQMLEAEALKRQWAIERTWGGGL